MVVVWPMGYLLRFCFLGLGCATSDVMKIVSAATVEIFYKIMRMLYRVFNVLNSPVIAANRDFRELRTPTGIWTRCWPNWWLANLNIPDAGTESSDRFSRQLVRRWRILECWAARLPWWWRQWPLKRRRTYVRLHLATSQRIVIC